MARCILRAVHHGRFPTAKPHLQTNPDKIQQTLKQSLEACRHGASKIHILGTKTSAQHRAPCTRGSSGHNLHQQGSRPRGKMSLEVPMCNTNHKAEADCLLSTPEVHQIIRCGTLFPENHLPPSQHTSRKQALQSGSLPGAVQLTTHSIN